MPRLVHHFQPPRGHTLRYFRHNPSLVTRHSPLIPPHLPPDTPSIVPADHRPAHPSRLLPLPIVCGPTIRFTGIGIIIVAMAAGPQSNRYMAKKTQRRKAIVREGDETHTYSSRELAFNRIHHMDCIEGMKRLTAGSVDLVITDPPFVIKFKAKPLLPFGAT